MTYESWRATFQSSEQAARSAFEQLKKLTEIKPVVEYWRHKFSTKSLFAVTNGIITEQRNWLATSIGVAFDGGDDWYKITAAEYLAASKPEAAYGKGTKLCDCGQIEAACKCKPEAVKTCGNCGKGCPDEHLGIVCKMWIPKPKQVKEIEQLPNHSDCSGRDHHEKIMELIEAVNQLKASDK